LKGVAQDWMHKVVDWATPGIVLKDVVGNEIRENKELRPV
jgi:hypothetical protein